MIRAAVFDFDGTLVDSSPGIFHTALFSIQKLGVTGEYSETDLRKFVGPPLKECFVRAFGLDPALIPKAVELYMEEYRISGYKMMDRYPGIEETLAELRDMGISLGVATNKGEELVKTCLDYVGLLGYFESVHGTDLREERTKAEIISMTVSDLGFGKPDAIMIGDTEADLIGAEDASVRFMGVTYGFGFTKPDGKHPFASDASSIVGIIRKINGGKYD